LPTSAAPPRGHRADRGEPQVEQREPKTAALPLGRVLGLVERTELNAVVIDVKGDRGFASDAFIVAPGGIGTLLEMVMVWQLLQVRQLQETPLILVGPPWPTLIEWARHAMLAFDPPLADAEDLAIPRCVASADEALAIIRTHHATWLRAQRAGDPPSRSSGAVTR